MAKYDGWMIKNKWGSLLFWTYGRTKSETREKVQWRVKSQGHKLIKVKIVEVE